MAVLKLNQIKQHNLAAALRQFCSCSALSRRELAARMQCDHATATRVVKKLLDDRLLCFSGKVETAHGRPREMLSLHPDSPVTLGLELGLDGVSGVILDLQGNLIGECFQSEKDCKSYPQALKMCVSELTEKLDRPLGASALAAIGTLDPERAVITECANCPQLNGWDLETFWQENLPLPMPFFTDRMIALMHRLTRQCRNWQSGLGMLVDTSNGIGMALAHDGEIINLQRRHGGEFGHNTVIPGGKRCRCGRRGCLEAYMSNFDDPESAGELFGLMLANQINNLLVSYCTVSGKLVEDTEFVCAVRRTVMQQLLGLAKAELELEFHPDSGSAASGAALLAKEQYLSCFAGI